MESCELLLKLWYTQFKNTNGGPDFREGVNVIIWEENTKI